MACFFYRLFDALEVSREVQTPLVQVTGRKNGTTTLHGLKETMLVRSLRRGVWASTTTVFPGIEVDRDEPEPYTPAPIRIDQKETEETIAEQAKGSACRLLRDRYVEDNGYLQSRSPFLLKAPGWQQLDTDRPEMTEDGALWEDVNHFVDYLTCRDVALAHDLNEVLLTKPEFVLEQFRMMVQLMHRPLCKHEVMGRGYVFSREPVLSPSDLIGRLVLKGTVGDLRKGMQYMWVLDASFVEHQRYVVQGMDLETMEKSCFLLVDAFRLLHESVAWTESHFVEVLQEMALCFPDMGNSLHFLASYFVLAELLVNKKLVMRRFIDIQRHAPSEIMGIELLNALGRFPQLLLNEEEDVFQSFIEWMPVIRSLGHDWKSSLQLCRALYAMWQEMDCDLDVFMKQLRSLQENLPKSLQTGLQECLDKKEEEWIHGHLFHLLQGTEHDEEKRSEVHEDYAELMEGLPEAAFLRCDREKLKANLDTLCENLKGVELYGTVSIKGLLKCHPKLLEDPSPAVRIYHRVWPVVCASVTKEELNAIREQATIADLIEAFQKLSDVMDILMEKLGFDQERIELCFREKAERVRKWKRNTDVPKEVVQFLNRVPASNLATLISMDAEAIEDVEESLFLLFGVSPKSIFSNLECMPELLLDDDALDLALSVSRCRKVTRSDLRNEQFRVADQHMSLLMETLKLTRNRTGIDEHQVLHYLEMLSDKKLLGNETAQRDSIELAQFCILCVEHPGAWAQFEQLMTMVHHPVLNAVRPAELHKMKNEAFSAILKSPEIFLIRHLWDQMIDNLEQQQWTFAGLDVDTVRTTEPCLLYYAVQHMWRKKFNRNAKTLTEAPPKRGIIKRRGKSIVTIQGTLP